MGCGLLVVGCGRCAIPQGAHLCWAIAKGSREVNISGLLFLLGGSASLPARTELTKQIIEERPDMQGGEIAAGLSNMVRVVGLSLATLSPVSPSPPLLPLVLAALCHCQQTFLRNRRPSPSCPSLLESEGKRRETLGKL